MIKPSFIKKVKDQYNWVYLTLLSRYLYLDFINKNKIRITL
jgi:hypothetical protein